MQEESRDKKAAVPNQAASEAQESLDKGRNYSGGDSLLDAEVEAKPSQPMDDSLEEHTSGDITKNVKNFNTTGAYPVDQKRLEQE